MLTSSVTVPVYSSEVFQLNKFSGYSQYTGLFDQYRFNEIEVWIEPTTSPSTASADVGTCVTAIDLDDTNVPTSVASVEDKQTALSTGGFSGHYHRWKPHMALAAYSGAFTSYDNAPANWIDSASPAVQHYGIKIAVTNTGSVVPYRISVRASVSFRQPGL